ncbi:MAG: hypothetical protein LBD06_03575 [Candidatus Accumulibacter sp.]|nr:hypothetical protein [Accumulibacter sp.]
MGRARHGAGQGVTEDRRQRTEDRGQKTVSEDRRQINLRRFAPGKMEKTHRLVFPSLFRREAPQADLSSVFSRFCPLTLTSLQRGPHFMRIGLDLWQEI